MGELTQEWKSRLGEVVWAKQKGCPWWPSIILHHPLDVPANVFNEAHRKYGKEYAVFYYGTDINEAYGFVSPKNIEPLVPGEVNSFLKQKTVTKNYQESFTTAKKIAVTEALLPVNERLAWIPRQTQDSESDNQEAENETQIRDEDELQNDEPTIQPSSETNFRSATNKKSKFDLMMEAEAEDDDEEDDDIPKSATKRVKSDDHPPRSFDPLINPTKGFKKLQKRAAVQEKQLYRNPARRVSNESTPSSSLSMIQSTPTIRRLDSNNVMNDAMETNEQRFTRLMNNLKFLSENMAQLNEEKAFKTIEKLSQLQEIQMEWFGSLDMMNCFQQFKKLSNARLSHAIFKLKRQWIDMFALKGELSQQDVRLDEIIRHNLIRYRSIRLIYECLRNHQNFSLQFSKDDHFEFNLSKSIEFILFSELNNAGETQPSSDNEGTELRKNSVNCLYFECIGTFFRMLDINAHYEKAPYIKRKLDLLLHDNGLKAWYHQEKDHNKQGVEDNYQSIRDFVVELIALHR